MRPEEFQRRVLGWFAVHGRKHLPWQQNPTPYRVWVSEIMLQQTQVATVSPYFQRFLERFPTVRSLADAELDEVLHLWSGLGYYARARNLHQAAVMMRDRHGSEPPQDIEWLRQIPGIGRSTAGAILALAGGQRHPILDGNVKRVLTRFHAVTGWPGDGPVQAVLWELAERYTPAERVAEYTQAMMDLGALVCTRHQPQCGLCPLADACLAHALGQETDYPTPKPRRVRPVRAVQLLILRAPTGEVLLEKRPPTGIWGGLWSFPECPLAADVADWCRLNLRLPVSELQRWPVIRYSFSHFQLDVTPVTGKVTDPVHGVMEAERFVWYNCQQPDARGLAAPVRQLMAKLTHDR